MDSLWFSRAFLTAFRAEPGESFSPRCLCSAFVWAPCSRHDPVLTQPEGFHGYFTQDDMFLTQWSKTQSIKWGGMSLSSSSGCSDSGDFDSMRIQLNLGGPLWRNNNNDKCTTVAGLKEAGRNVLLCRPVFTQLAPGSCRIRRFSNKISPCERLCFLGLVSSFKYSDDMALCNIQTSLHVL